MAKVALDFGTANTALARFNETTGQAETVEIPGITTAMTYRLAPDAPQQTVHVVPSMIYYSQTETLIGNQVLSRGLAEHNDTFRWMKRAIAHKVSRRKKTPQGHKSPAQAGEDFLRLLLNYASDRISLKNDEFTFCAPTEAFEDFQDWLRRLAESLGIRRLRVLDEPTACVLGYHGAARRDDHFLVFDFGCGTLDISVVRIDLASAEDRKAIQLGQAGRDLGGMDIDRWMAEDFCRRHGLDDADRRHLETVILRQAEAVKIALSDPALDEGEVTVIDGRSRTPRLLKMTFYRCCPECERCRDCARYSQCDRARDGRREDAGQSCLKCLLEGKGFLRNVRQTLDRALENAAVKSGLRRDDLTKVLVTGGTSLVPSVRRVMTETFNTLAEYQSPFDAVVRGACRGTILPVLQHDYAIESYNAQRRAYEFCPLFKIGTDYPTPSEETVRLWALGAYDGMTRIGMKVFEVSRMRRTVAGGSLTDEEGRLRDDTHVVSEFSHVCLNADNPTFILADPPVNLERDRKRFLCSFQVDGHRRLLVSVLDNHSGKTLLKDHPVVRL